MKTIVLDANELSKDWMLRGLKYQLFQHLDHATWFSVCVPAVVLEELIANYSRAASKAEATGRRLNVDRKLLGLRPAEGERYTFDYRAYLEDHLGTRLAFTVLPWPATSHQEIVARAVTRTPPFDEKGSGYRDSLVWSDVVELARAGCDVAFVSMDKVFAGEGNRLAPALEAEVAGLVGSVELVRDFNQWLIAALPWESVPDLTTAVNYSRNAEFLDYYFKSDFQTDLEPTAEDLGFSRSPSKLEIVDVQWDGRSTLIEGARASEGGLSLVEYELGQTVEFVGDFPEGIDPEDGWHVSAPSFFRQVSVEGSVEMVLRIAVLFGGDLGFSIEELSWSRADGSGPGAPIYTPELDPRQRTLWDQLPVGDKA